MHIKLDTVVTHGDILLERGGSLTITHALFLYMLFTILCLGGGATPTHYGLQGVAPSFFYIGAEHEGVRAEMRIPVRRISVSGTPKIYF